MPSAHRYFVLNKPYGMESQFISAHAGPLLGDLSFGFPEGTHAIGRLDKDSEGLLLLTTNKKITRLLFQSGVPHERKYLVQVRHEVQPESLQKLREGLSIRIRGGGFYTTPPCDAQVVEEPVSLFRLPFPVIQYQPTTWLLITLTEGKYRQVRKMVNAIRHRCIRLIRISIEDLLLQDLQPGCIREMEEADFFSQLKL